MAVWRINRDLRVTYQDPRACEGKEQDCGKPSSPETGFDDVLAWSVRQGDAGDVIVSPNGLLVRQADANA